MTDYRNAQRLASNQDLMPSSKGSTLYHIIIEATIALTVSALSSSRCARWARPTAVSTRVHRGRARRVTPLSFASRSSGGGARGPQRFPPLIQKRSRVLPLVSGTHRPPDPKYITEFGHPKRDSPVRV